MTNKWDGRPPGEAAGRKGWHWIMGPDEVPLPAYWQPELGGNEWFYGEGNFGVEYAALTWSYLGPCLTPNEAAAERAAQWCAGQDAVIALARQRADLIGRGQDPGSAGYANGCDDVAIFGEALTPPAADASALAALLAQARRDALTDAARIARDRESEGGEYGLAARHIAAAVIRAAAAEDAA